MPNANAMSANDADHPIATIMGLDFNQPRLNEHRNPEAPEVRLGDDRLREAIRLSIGQSRLESKEIMAMNLRPPYGRFDWPGEPRSNGLYGRICGA